MQSDERYSRQIRFAPIGVEGQGRISASRVALIGAGALGSVAAELLVRAGVAYIRIVDRDFVESSNLQRQSLYDEEDVRLNLPKAEAAAGKLRRINSGVQIESVVDDVNPSNVEDFIDGVDLVLDALDNFETRFVLNDACAKQSRTWIYGAAVGSYGLVMPIMPGRSVTGFSGVPSLSLGTTFITSSSGTANPMPASCHSNPAVSVSLDGEIGTMTPITRPSMATSWPP